MPVHQARLAKLGLLVGKDLQAHLALLESAAVRATETDSDLNGKPDFGSRLLGS